MTTQSVSMSLPSHELPATCDVLVIGAGVVGATVAYEMSRRGLSVTVVDAGTDVGHGCSYANAGLLSADHVEVLATPANVREGLTKLGRAESPLRVHPRPTVAPWLAGLAWSARPERSRLVSIRLRELARTSVEMHLAYPEQGIDTGVRKSGSLDVFSSPLPVSKEAEDGATISDAREREPELVHSRNALPHPEDATVESRTYVRAVLAAAARHGTQVVWDAPVVGIDRQDGRIVRVRTRQGQISPGTTVLAAGLASGDVAAHVGLSLPLRGGRGYVVDLEPVEGHRLGGPVTFRDRRVVATPYEDRLRLCGTLELGGDDLREDPRRFAAVLGAGQDELGRAASGEVIEKWSGLRPCTRDGAPVIGRSSRVPDLLVAAGHGMWGLVLAPVTGRLLTEGLLDNAPTLHDPSLTPDRFDNPTLWSPRRLVRGRNA